MKTDYQIQKNVMAQLNWEPILNASEIGVAVKDGVVTLSGIVDTYTKKMEAERAARKVYGVRAVAPNIQVGVSPIFKKTDSEIAETVLNALRLHTAVMEDRIRIKVENGTVTLEGDVEWEYQRKAAVTAIENLPGVRDVFNFIIVKPKVAAKDIEKKISAAFHRHATIDAEKVTAEIIGSKVILKGIVRSLAEKEDAENAVWPAPGVTTVDNRLIVEEEIGVF
ncbi:MAG: BON domain-containing protein [Chitinophagales bacterium]